MATERSVSVSVSGTSVELKVKLPFLFIECAKQESEDMDCVVFSSFGVGDVLEEDESFGLSVKEVPYNASDGCVFDDVIRTSDG